MGKILMTGGAGFIGSNFVRYILETYPKEILYNLDKLTYAGNIESLNDIIKNSNYRFIKGDISDKKLVNELIEENKFDVVINFAAESHVDRSITSPDEFVKTNILGTQTLLHAAYLNKVPLYIQVSTDEVYGTLGPTGLFTEESPIQPNSPYSASKAGADLIVRSYFETYNYPAIITRCSNNYGPYQFPEKLIPLFITNLLDDKKVPVYGDGMNIRDWIHVLDHCRAIDTVRRTGKPGEVYNIGGNTEKTNIEITDKLLNLLNKTDVMKEYVTDRLGHDRRYAVDSTKIETKLGFKLKVDFETGIKDTISWYKNNEDWWRPLKK